MFISLRSGFLELRPSFRTPDFKAVRTAREHGVALRFQPGLLAMHDRQQEPALLVRCAKLRAGIKMPDENPMLLLRDRDVLSRLVADSLENLRRHRCQALLRRVWHDEEFVRIASPPTGWNRYAAFLIEGVPELSEKDRVGSWRVR